MSQNRSQLIIQWLKKNILNVILFSLLAYILSQRIPNWIDLWKLEGREAKNFSAIVLRPAISPNTKNIDSSSNSPTTAHQLANQMPMPDQLSTNNGLTKNALLIPQELHKPAALIFWATWCGPCQIEISRVRELVAENKIKAEQVYLLSIAEDPELILKTATERNYPFHLLHDMNGDAFNFYKVRATPTTVFIDQAGKISWIGTGLSPTLGLRMEKHLKQ